MNYQIKKRDNLYFLVDENDNIIDSKRSIGLNRFNDLLFSDSFSYYDGELEVDDKVYLGNPLGEQRIASIGNLIELYRVLEQVLKKNRDSEFVDVCASIQIALNYYFGTVIFDNDIPSYFPTEKEVASGNVARGKISNLENKNVATSFVRAMASQYILKTLGYESGIKISMVKINGKEEARAYNLVKHNDKYYIFDSSLPNLIDERINPIICEIPKEVYDSLRYPRNSYPKDIEAYAVRVKHYNPLPCEFCEVIYDSCHKKIYDVETNKTK